MEEVNQDQTIQEQVPAEQFKPKSPFPKFILIFIVVLVLGLIGGAYYLGVSRNQPKACTNEAMICPDGSAVGRTGPNCEFSPCPSSKSEENDNDSLKWKDYENNKLNISFKLPNNWSTKEQVSKKGNGITIETGILSNSAYGPIDPPKYEEYTIGISELKDIDSSSLKRSLVSSVVDGFSEDVEKFVALKEEKIGNYTIYKTNDFPSFSGALNVFIKKKSTNNFIYFVLLPYREDKPYKNQEEVLKTFDQILSAFKFTENITEGSNQSTGKTKVINYQLPSGWQIVKDGLSRFEVGYDSTKYNVNSSSVGIDFNSKACCSSIFFKLLPYDGGSRHTFIKNQGALKLSSTVEKEYVISGKSALFMYNVDFSGSNTAGVVVINNSQALFISSQSSNQALIEQVLSTLKFTQ